MLMVDNDIKEGEESDNVSIHSIVSDQVEFDSDNESPQDQVGQVDKIIMNHVIKYILEPGYGVDKPSKFDYVDINYKAYFKDTNEIIINSTDDKEYLYNIVLPYGIVKAIKFMRKGERARIILEPKYGFRKVEKEKIGRYLDINKIDKKCNIDELYEKLTKNALIYEVELKEFIKMYDLTGRRNLMKRIIEYPDKHTINRPMENSEIIFNLKIYNNAELVIDVNKCKSILNEDNFTYAERTIFKSMKKKEKCKVYIILPYFIECYNNSKKTLISKQIEHFASSLKETDTNVKISYEVELLKFKNNISHYYFKNKDYTKTEIIKGIGNVSPWKDAIIMLFCHVMTEEDNKVLYSDLPKGKSLEEFIAKIKEIKQRIKKIPFYETQAQFIVDTELKKENIELPIYDPMLMNFPTIFRKEIVQSMKPLSVNKIQFTIEKDNIEDNLFLFDNNKQNICDSLDFTNKNSYNITFTCCLLNMEENVFVLYNKLLTNKVEKLEYYKSIANDFFKKGYLHRSKKLNKKLSDNYNKYCNLGTTNKVTFNEEGKETKEIEDVTTSTNYDKNIDDIMRKIMSNLIIILYKMNRRDQCEKYIHHFLRLYVKDEKIMYYKYKILNEKGNFEAAEKILESMIEFLEEKKQIDNISLYKSDLEVVKKRIEQGKHNHINYMKKMMKVIK